MLETEPNTCHEDEWDRKIAFSYYLSISKNCKIMSITELIMKRRSCRKFTDEPISDSDIKELKRAALCSPTSKNCKSWEFVFVRDKATLKSISEAKESGAAFVAEAPLAIIVLADEGKTDVWVEDASIAATIIQLQAESLGLGSCWAQMRGRGHSDGRTAQDIIAALVGARQGLQVECVIAIGHKADERRAYDDERLSWAQVHDERF